MNSFKKIFKKALTIVSSVALIAGIAVVANTVTNVGQAEAATNWNSVFQSYKTVSKSIESFSTNDSFAFSSGSIYVTGNDFQEVPGPVGTKSTWIDDSTLVLNSGQNINIYKIDPSGSSTLWQSTTIPTTVKTKISVTYTKQHILLNGNDGNFYDIALNNNFQIGAVRSISANNLSLQNDYTLLMMKNQIVTITPGPESEVNSWIYDEDSGSITFYKQILKNGPDTPQSNSYGPKPRGIYSNYNLIYISVYACCQTNQTWTYPISDGYELGTRGSVSTPGGAGTWVSGSLAGNMNLLTFGFSKNDSTSYYNNIFVYSTDGNSVSFTKISSPNAIQSTDTVVSQKTNFIAFRSGSTSKIYKINKDQVEIPQLSNVQVTSPSTTGQAKFTWSPSIATTDGKVVIEDSLDGKTYSSINATTTISGLVRGTRTFDLYVETAFGNSTKITTDPITIQVIPAAINTNQITATNIGRTAIVTWTAPSNATQAGPITYKVYPSSYPAQYVETTNLTAEIPNVPSGNQRFTVQAIGPDGTSTASSYYAYTIPNASDPVRNLALSKDGNNIHLSWDTPTKFTNLQNYTVYVKNNGVLVDTKTIPSDQTVADLNLPNGIYTFEVTATDSVGESSKVSKAINIVDVPNPVPFVNAQYISSNVQVTWGVPSNSGNIPTGITYRIKSIPDTTTKTTSSTSATFTNLSEGYSYQFSVEAISEEGTSTPVYSSVIDLNNGVDAPTWTYQLENAGQIQLGWIPPVGITVTGYRLQCVDLDDPTYGKTWDLPGTTTDYNPQFDKLGLGDRYYCVVRVKTSTGMGKPSIQTSEMIPYLAPDKVVNPTVAENSRVIGLSWTAPYDNGSAITKYTVNMTNLSTNESFNTTVSEATSHTFNNLVNGNRYQFLIYAINAAGTSPVASITGTPRTTPSDARTGTLTANSPGSASVTGSWKEAIDNGGAPVSYKVKLFNVTTGQYVYNTTTTGLQVTVGSLQWDNQYKLEVTATNAAGDSKNIITSNTVTVFNLPEKPGNVLAVAGIESATITWTTPVSNGATITGYRISGAGKTVDVDSSKNSVTIDGLTPSQQVRFTVTVLSDRGQGRVETTPLTGITIVGHPSAPRITNIKEGAYSLNASWAIGYGINATGNSPVTGYEVTLFDMTDSTQSEPEIITASNKQFTDLTPGHNYKVGVKVINAVGMSPQSQSGTVKPYGTPDPVKSVIAKKIDDYTAQVSFTPGFNNYDLAVYQIDAVNLQDNSVVMSKTIGSNTALFTNFPASSAYKFVITARNKAGSSISVDSNVLLMDERTGASNQPGDGGEPGETNDPDKTPIVISEDVNWSVTANASNRSAILNFPNIENVTNYYITVINHTNSLNGGQVLKVSSNEVTVNNLHPLEEYSFTVIGLNSVSSTSEIESNTVIPYSTPDQPDIPIVSSTGTNSATINWNSSNFYGSAIQSYTVRGVSNDGGKSVSKNVTGSTLSTTLEGLSSGRHYTFQVLATNQYGSSKWSDMSESVIINGVPEKPMYAEAVSQNGAIKVTWSTPENANTTGVTSYTVTSNKGNTQTVTGTNSIFTGLTVGDSYSFTIYATNQYGNSATVKSNTVKFLTQPDSPGIAVATPAPGSAFVEITPSINTGGEPVEYYTVRAINLDNDANGGQTARVYNGAAIVNGLTNGDHYSFVVTATNSVGTSDPSIPSNIVVPLTGPVAKNSESDNTQLTVDWTGVFEQGSGNNYTVTLKDLTVPSSQVNQVNNLTEFTTNTELNLGHYYSFSIDNGSGERLSNIVMPYGAPGPVSNVVSVTNEISTLTATWNAATVTNGRNLQNYKVELYKEMGNVLVKTGTSGVNNRTITFDELLADNYYVKVYAVNAAGESTPVTSNSVTVYSLPTAPRMASIIPNDALVTTNWLAPVNTGGVTLNNYTVRLTDQTEGKEVTQWSSNDTTGFSFSHIFNELENGHKYTFAVMTSNQFGDSDWSVESNYVIPGSYYSMELPPAALDLGNPDDTGMVNVYIESEITLTLSDDSVTLTEIPDMTTTETDNEMVYSVKTNSIAGFNVTLNSDSDALSPSTQGNNETFDFSDVKAWNSESSSDDSISLSTDPGLIQSSDTKTDSDGQDFTTKFSADIPWINADTYTGTVTYTATTN